MRGRIAKWAVIAQLIAGCGGDGEVRADAAIADTGVPCTAPAEPSRIVVTADWMSRSLTLLGLERVLDRGCSAEDARVGAIDLSEWAPGPIELEIAPDGRTALVAIGPGFFDGTGGALVGNPDPETEHALLVVDLEAREVVAELETRDAPMGLAIAPDGARAYAAGFGVSGAGGSSLVVIDLEARSVLEEIEVGPRPEQVALSADGTLGALSLAGSDAIRVFRTDDVAGSLSDPVVVGRDPSDIAFVPGTERLVVATSMRVGYAIVDVSDPAAPSVVATPGVSGGIPYAATWIPGTTDVLLTTSIREQLLRVSAMDGEAAPSLRVPLTGGAFLLGVGVTADGAHAIVPHPRSHELSIVELASGVARSIVMERTEAGPTYVAIQP